MVREMFDKEKASAVTYRYHHRAQAREPLELETSILGESSPRTSRDKGAAKRRRAAGSGRRPLSTLGKARILKPWVTRARELLGCWPWPVA